MKQRGNRKGQVPGKTSPQVSASGTTKRLEGNERISHVGSQTEGTTSAKVLW